MDFQRDIVISEVVTENIIVVSNKLGKVGINCSL